MTQGFYQDFKMNPGTIALLCAAEGCTIYDKNNGVFVTDFNKANENLKSSGFAGIIKR